MGRFSNRGAALKKQAAEFNIKQSRKDHFKNKSKEEQYKGEQTKWHR